MLSAAVVSAVVASVGLLLIGRSREWELVDGLAEAALSAGSWIRSIGSFVGASLLGGSSIVFLTASTAVVHQRGGL
jgi:hypothetical protein